MCWACAAVFPVLSVMGGTMQPALLLWQPAVIGGLFLAGQLFTLLAVARGDVSIAAPVLGIKVLFVPMATALFMGQALPLKIWVASAIAVAGIACVQTRDAKIQRAHIVAAVGFALLASCSMTLFDLLIQQWAPAWGAGYFLPIAFLFAGLISLAFVSRVDGPTAVRELGATRPLSAGSFLMALQAIGMTVTLGIFGDATRVNIVYSLRGIWGVVLTWMLSHAVLAAGRPATSHRTMTMRLIGAALIGISVVISVT